MFHHQKLDFQKVIKKSGILEVRNLKNIWILDKFSDDSALSLAWLGGLNDAQIPDTYVVIVLDFGQPVLRWLLWGSK